MYTSVITIQMTAAFRLLSAWRESRLTANGPPVPSESSREIERSQDRVKWQERRQQRSIEEVTTSKLLTSSVKALRCGEDWVEQIQIERLLEGLPYALFSSVQTLNILLFLHTPVKLTDDLQGEFTFLAQRYQA